ncbi:hypothetical protein E2C01_067237 [Portunus trituberculatus]|uniref:Uncharacterized protein n=1 Tax=Portunus trituberculatus TaxID=210409 RepID=A0A5B7HNK9_PORTR|nr:hypothetical protein [Portunus trituberculatus]
MERRGGSLDNVAGGGGVRCRQLPGDACLTGTPGEVRGAGGVGGRGLSQRGGGGNSLVPREREATGSEAPRSVLLLLSGRQCVAAAGRWGVGASRAWARAWGTSNKRHMKACNYRRPDFQDLSVRNNSGSASERPGGASGPSRSPDHACGRRY